MTSGSRRAAKMSEQVGSKPDYGNWVSTRFIYVPGALALLFVGLAFVVPVLAIVAVVFLMCAVYFAYARHMFSPDGGNIQSRVLDLLVSRLDWDGEGKALDIGCGSGPAAIEVAKKYPNAHVTGMDLWGATWEYSKSVCERNAEIEGVAERVTFQQANASSLPFDDEAYDLVVSNMVFHEVSAIRDKSSLVKEALRVLRKGGRFAFQDLFLWKAAYGEVDDLLEVIRSWGIGRVELVDTSVSDFIPKALKLPFMVGTAGIIHGKK